MQTSARLEGPTRSLIHRLRDRDVVAPASVPIPLLVPVLRRGNGERLGAVGFLSQVTDPAGITEKFSYGSLD